MPPFSFFVRFDLTRLPLLLSTFNTARPQQRTPRSLSVVAAPQRSYSNRDAAKICSIYRDGLVSQPTNRVNKLLRMMQQFLVQRADRDREKVPAGFVLLEDFACPNCSRVVHIARTANSSECIENISRARNAVTLQCPDHDTPTPILCEM
jgi:hypothetical protein